MLLQRLTLLATHISKRPLIQLARMSTSNTSPTLPSIPLNIQPPTLTRTDLYSFPAFRVWLTTLSHSLSLQHTTPTHEFHAHPYTLRSIDVQAVDYFGKGRLGFVKLKADVRNDLDETLPGSVFLRGGSVGMLLLLEPSDTNPSNLPDSERHAILTLQPRIPAGSLALPELPAGMLDDSGSFAGKAAQEIHEETGLEFTQEELVDMTALTAQLLSNEKSAQSKEGKEGKEGKEELQAGVYPSPGGCDEYVPLFLCRKRMERKKIEELQGKLTGLRGEGEKISLMVVPVGELWTVGFRDGKTLAAWALYCGLRERGLI